MQAVSENRRVEEVVRAFKEKTLQVPEYQRSYCWTEAKAKNFLERTKQLGQVLGVITAYKLVGSHVEFLQDGLQRITTLGRVLDNPGKYDVTKEDAHLLANARICYQSMQYEDHDVARMDFQHLNDGMGLVPYEKYRGDLEKDTPGKDLYEFIRAHVMSVAFRISGESATAKPNRKLAGQLHRCSLGLFFQYVTKHRETQLYAKSERNISTQIERRVRSWLEGNRCEWENEANNFIRALERINAQLETATANHNSKRWDTAAIRGFYSAYFYISNIGCSTEKFIQLIDWYVLNNLKRSRWPSRFEVEVNGIPQSFRIDQSNLKWLSKLELLGGPEISELKRKKTIHAPAGYHESHVIPHADGGKIVVVEPAISNLQRGRAPMTEETLTILSPNSPVG